MALYSWAHATRALYFLQIKKIIIFKEMAAEMRFINFRLDGSHVTSRAGRCDVTEFKKLSLSNSDHIVLAPFGVNYDSRFVIDVLYKKFTKLLTDPRIQLHLITSRFFLISTCLENIQHCKHMHYVPCQRQVYNFPECNKNNDM